ncbi:MAG TPA: insulinase family protein, partial [Bacteroidales bacterium]|nr:insulinase family protein [Bacteroidales bacterium]
KRITEVKKDIPSHAIYKAWKMVPRNHPDYYAFDLISDVLANGDSSRLFQNLLKEKKLFTNIDAYITGELDEGMLIVSGNLSDGVSMSEAEQAIDEEITQLKEHLVDERELQKVKNKIEASTEFQEISGINKTYLLSYFELLGDASDINKQVDKYRQVSTEDIRRVAKNHLTEEKSSVLHYLSEHKS